MAKKYMILWQIQSIFVILFCCKVFISIMLLLFFWGGEDKLVKIADVKKKCFIFKGHVREGYVCFANM